MQKYQIGLISFILAVNFLYEPLYGEELTSGTDFYITHSEKYSSRYEATMRGRRFYNIDPIKHHNAWDMIKWGLTRDCEKWPKWVDIAPGKAPPERVDMSRLRYTVVNHASVLIQVDGKNILTDPIWSKRASMVQWAGPKRVIPPGIPFDKLPKIDIVLVSHNHYDHMDIPTLKRLKEKDNPLIVAGLGNSRTLKRHGMTHIKELDWWQGFHADGLAISFVPARHFCRRGAADYNLALWGGFVIKASDCSVCFIGDSGYGDFMKEIGRRFGRIDLAFIPIGAYKPAWLMETIHLTPEEAWQVHEDLGARLSVGIHFGTFQLTDEGIHDPAKRLQTLVSENGNASNMFVVPTFGEGVDVR